MGRNQNGIKTVTITISTTKRTKEYLEALVSRGLSGKNPAEAAERLVTTGIENLLEEGKLNGKNGRKVGKKR